MDSIDLHTGENPATPTRRLSVEEVQSAFWALLFICAELSLGFIIMREKLIEKGVLTPEDQEFMDKLSSQEDQLQQAYGHMEKVFGERFQRVRSVVRDPEILEKFAQEQQMKNVSRPPEDKGEDDGGGNEG